jgi:hypothetical protein
LTAVEWCRAAPIRTPQPISIRMPAFGTSIRRSEQVEPPVKGGSTCMTGFKPTSESTKSSFFVFKSNNGE